MGKEFFPITVRRTCKRKGNKREDNITTMSYGGSLKYKMQSKKECLRINVKLFTP